MSARDEVLARIRGALGEIHRPSQSPAPTAAPGEHAPGSAELVGQLVDRLEDYRPPSSDDRDDDADRAARHGHPRPAVPARHAVRHPGRPGQHPCRGGRRTTARRPRGLDRIDAVVTGSVAAISETGTIVLDGSPGAGDGDHARARRPRLRRPRPGHRADSARGPPAAGPRSPLTFVSGPSATSDIELTASKACTAPGHSSSSSRADGGDALMRASRPARASGASATEPALAPPRVMRIRVRAHLRRLLRGSRRCP